MGDPALWNTSQISSGLPWIMTEWLKAVFNCYTSFCLILATGTVDSGQGSSSVFTESLLSQSGMSYGSTASQLPSNQTTPPQQQQALPSVQGSYQGSAPQLGLPQQSAPQLPPHGAYQQQPMVSHCVGQVVCTVEVSFEVLFSKSGKFCVWGLARSSQA